MNSKGTKDGYFFVSRVNILTTDKEIKRDLSQMESDMFQVRNEKNIKNFKNNFGVELKED